jgi:twinkle protein
MSEYDDDDSTLIGREPCPKCGSRDNLARYSDGHAYCFSAGCEHYERGANSGGGEDYVPTRKASNPALIQGTFSALSKRKLTEETVTRYGYKVGRFNGAMCQIATYTDWSGNPVAQKLRFADKGEGMPWVGSNKEVALFGAHLGGKGKRLVITEGEIDAMSVSQIQGNKWPVVSLINGASGAKKDLARSLDYLKNFDEIVLMFDMDEAGRTAVEAAAEVLTGLKVLVASLPLKDANECLLAGRADAVVQAIWNAKPWSPASVLSGQSVIDRRRSRPKVTSYALPEWLPEMAAKVLGDRLGELTTWTSGSGMGKTTMLRQLQLHFYRTTNFNQALIMLEEPLEDTADEMVATYIEKRMKLPEVARLVTEEEIQKAEEDLFLSTDEGGNHRLYFHDAFGSVGSDTDLMNRIRYFAHAHDCKIIWLDHLSILVSDMDQEGDERRRIDALMHQLKGLTVELGISIHLVCHLKKAGGNVSFEEGAVPSLDDLRGSGGIKQLSNNVYAISRNQQAETETERNTAQVHVLKCRYTGDTGQADFIFFNKLTGVFERGVDPSIPFTDMTDEFGLAAMGGGADLDVGF